MESSDGTTSYTGPDGEIEVFSLVPAAPTKWEEPGLLGPWLEEPVVPCIYPLSYFLFFLAYLIF